MTVIVFTIYLLVLVVIGYLAYQRTQNHADFVLGGRTLGPVPSALSAGASDMSGWLLLGLPGYAMASGYGAFWLAGGLLVGTWLNWLLVARRLRIYSKKADDSLTLPAFFENRFEDRSHLLRIISAAFILIFFLFYTASGLVAGGKLFETVFGLDYQVAVFIGAAAIVSYTLVGGFLAVSWTDVLQGLLMMAALAVVPLMAMGELGGPATAFDTIASVNPALLELFTDEKGQAITLIGTLSLLGWGLGYFGQPHILARFKGIRSDRQVPTARRIAVAWTGISMAGACLIGLVAVAYLPNGLADTETVFIVMVEALFHPVIAGILLAAILAAVMSTADSQLLVSSSAFTEDFYKSILRRQVSDKHLMHVGRGGVLVIALIATFLAMDKDSSVLSLVAYAWAGFGAAFGPVLILSLYWRAMTKVGAVAGIVTGGLTVIIWKQLEGGWFELYEIVPGVVLAFLAAYLFSRVTAAPAESVTKCFDDVAREVG